LISIRLVFKQILALRRLAVFELKLMILILLEQKMIFKQPPF